jgi:hypothetical protein
VRRIISHLESAALTAAFMLASGTAWAEDLGAALDRSFALEQEGKAAEAAKAIEAAKGEVAADYAVELRLGWLWFLAADYSKARAHYTQAATISQGGLDPRLGLAWCALREGRTDDAHAGFAAILDEAPDHASAREGLALAQSVPTLVAKVGAGTTGHYYVGAASKKWGAAAEVDLDLAWRNGVRLGARYEFIEFGARGRGAQKFQHHAALVDVGYETATYGFSAHYGLLADKSSLDVMTHVIGARLALHMLGDISVELSAALPEGEDPVLRIAPAWRVALGSGFAVTPTVALQRADGEVLYNVGLTASWDAVDGGAWVSGKYGAELRPVYLDANIAYDNTEKILYGASVGGWTPVSTSWGMTFAYEWARYGVETTATTIESDAHFLKIGAFWSSEPLE